MMMSLCCDVLRKLQGKKLVTAESCTGGMIGAALTAVPGSSEVFKGGIICYTNFVKEQILGVSGDLLKTCGAVSEPVAGEMAKGVRKLLGADVSVSVTGLAGPSGDEFGNPVGTVFISCETEFGLVTQQFHFSGDRDEVRRLATVAALKLVLECI